MQFLKKLKIMRNMFFRLVTEESNIELFNLRS